MNSTKLNCQNVVLNFMCCVKFMYLCVENPRKQVGLNALPEQGRDILFSYLFSTPKMKSILCFNVLYDDLRFLWDNYKRLSGRRRFFCGRFYL